MNAKELVAKWRKRPLEIEARQFFNDGSSYDLLRWINEGQHALGGVSAPFAEWHNNKISVPTPEGVMVAHPGDWIIRGVAGEFYPCKPDIFAATYEAALAPAGEAVPDPMLQRVVEALVKLATHVRPTCSDLYDEAIAALTAARKVLDKGVGGEN